jgi:CDP-glucose 4,6-dehydratase
MFQDFYKGKTILITGHTGFKGAWLSEWLLSLGARVIGVALEPPTDPSLFELLKLRDRMEHHVVDVRNASALKKVILAVNPDVFFHLAAQPLVLNAYDNPAETYAVNLMGTIHVLEGLLSLTKPCSALMITTDKCYENKEWIFGYREEDPMGGFDPYSTSKACCELAIASYRRSFFDPTKSNILLASARAGNVIGGGDWGEFRLIPDCVRAIQAGNPIRIRNPKSVRPWQHVLEPLSGYLKLAQSMTSACGDAKRLQALCSGFNFGPLPQVFHTVRDCAEQFVQYWPAEIVYESKISSLHEAGLLALSIDKATRLLDWHPVWDFSVTLKRTVEWYRAWATDRQFDARAYVLEDIEAYKKQVLDF